MKIMTTLEYNRMLWRIDSLEHTVKGLRRVCDDQEAALEKEWNKNQQLTEELQAAKKSRDRYRKLAHAVERERRKMQERRRAQEEKHDSI